MIKPTESARSRPEGRWLWRRLYVFVSTASGWLLLDRLVELTPPEALVPLSRGILFLLALSMVLYLVAPTAQQLITGMRIFTRGRS
jgi:hypothetical protein